MKSLIFEVKEFIYYGPQNVKKVGEKQAELLIDLDT
jgi:hypothetical protein